MGGVFLKKTYKRYISIYIQDREDGRWQDKMSRMGKKSLIQVEDGNLVFNSNLFDKEKAGIY